MVSVSEKLYEMQVGSTKTVEIEYLDEYGRKFAKDIEEPIEIFITHPEVIGTSLFKSTLTISSAYIGEAHILLMRN